VLVEVLNKTKGNVLFIVSAIPLIICLVNYALGISMIELWQISVALLAVSFGAWFEIHSKYDDDVKEKKRRRLGEVRDEVVKISKTIHGGKNEKEIEEELGHLASLYEKSNEPINVFEMAWNSFSYAGLIFLVSIFCRLGSDLLSLSGLSAVEDFTFLFGIFFFILAILNTRNLMILLSSDKDPLTPILGIAVIAIVQALHSYLIWQLSTIPLITSIYFFVFYVLLWFTFAGAALFWIGIESKSSKKSYIGLTIMYSPWIWLVILSLLLRFGLIK
jgi:hypothetical protein